jgi:hypothetical protein
MHDSLSINGNAAVAAEPSLHDLQAPNKTEPTISGEGKITIGGVTSTLGYSLRAITEGVTEVVMNIGEGVGNSFRTLVKHPGIAVTAATIGLAAVPEAQSVGFAAKMLDGTTRAEMTTDNPALDGFFASGVSGSSGNNATLTHLWGPYYGIAAHEVEGGLSINAINLDRNYTSGSSDLVGISRIDISSSSDFAIITAATADNSLRDLNSKIVGIAVATTGSSTIYDNLSAPANLAFINQVTGSNITEEQILSGQSIIAAPSAGEHVWSEGYGAWGTPATGPHDPDGMPGDWQGLYIPNGGGLNGTYSDTTIYFSSSFVNDGGLTNGPMNGAGLSIDSGAIGIISVPETGAAQLLVVGLSGLLVTRCGVKKLGTKMGR